MKANQNENRQQDTYQTGDIHPPKGRQGLIAGLLVLVIFLGGIVSALSMLNIRLFRLLDEKTQATESSALSFSRSRQSASERDIGTELTALGIVGQEVTDMCRSYYGWPAGIYVSQIRPDGPAEQAGLELGDILVALDGVTIAEEETLLQKLNKTIPGRRMHLRVFRGGKQFTLLLTAHN